MESIKQEKEDFKLALKRKHAKIEEPEQNDGENDVIPENDVAENDENDIEQNDSVEAPPPAKKKKKKHSSKVENVEAKKSEIEVQNGESTSPKKKLKKNKPKPDSNEPVMAHDRPEKPVDKPTANEKSKKKTKKNKVETTEKVPTPTKEPKIPEDEVQNSPKLKKAKKKKVSKDAEIIHSELQNESEVVKKPEPSEKIITTPESSTKLSKKEKKKLKKPKDTKLDQKSVTNDEPKSPIFEKTDWGDFNLASIKTTPKPTNSQAIVFKKKSKSAEKPKNPTINLLKEKEKKRRISFALSQNEFSSFKEIDRSMQESPDIPYQPAKTPSQGVLKTKSASNTPNKYITPKSMVGYNTQMNGKSKAAKKLGINSKFMFFN